MFAGAQAAPRSALVTGGSVNLTRQAVQDAPPYDPAMQLDRKRESEIYKHYGRPGYWADGE